MKKNNLPLVVLIIIVLGTVAVFAALNFFRQTPREKTELDLEGEAGVSSVEAGEQEREAYPILASLPLKNALYTIGYQFENDAPVITVETNEAYLETALQALNNLGTEGRPASSYNVKITGLEEENPFEGVEFFADQTEENPGQFIAKGYNYLPFEFTVKGGEEEGDYYYTVLTTGSEETYNLLKYRVVLEKTSAGWTLKAAPACFLTTSNTSALPASLLDHANRL